MSDTSLLSMTPLIRPGSADAATWHESPRSAEPRAMHAATESTHTTTTPRTRLHHLAARVTRALTRCTDVASGISTRISTRLAAAITSTAAPCDDADEAGDASDAEDPSHDRGQATTEYALVMLAAALVALLIVAWATAGGGAGKVGRLFDRILDEVISRV